MSTRRGHGGGSPRRGGRLTLATWVIVGSAMVITACSSNSPVPTALTSGTPAPKSTACTSNSVLASLDPPANAPTSGQVTFQLRYTNTSESPCVTEGYPGATLTGPDQPDLGPDFQLRRSTIRPPEALTVAPGKSVVADLTVLTSPPGGDGAWQPTQLSTTAPDDTTAMTLSWPPNTPVLRQDGATHPGSFIGTLHAIG